MTDVPDPAQALMRAADAARVTSSISDAAQAVRSFIAEYEYGLQEVSTKVEILQDQFLLRGGHNPIEHVKTRVKSPESIVDKARRRGVRLELSAIRQEIRDIAGMRITCPYVSDAYQVADALRRQQDLVTLLVKDYIANPKPNGYRSLHLHVSVPVFLPDQTIHVPVEVQIRTIAMDFWASTEHELRYKFAGELPPEVSRTLSDVAATATALDAQMAQLRDLAFGSEQSPAP